MRRRPFIVLLALLPLWTGGAACSNGGGEDAAPATTSTAPVPPVLAWTVVATEHNGTAPPGDDVVAAVTATLDAYLSEAVVAPLYTGGTAGDLSRVLSAVARERLAVDPGAKATLLDEGLPKATSIVAERADVTLASVAGPDAVVALVAARLDLKVHATGPGLDLDIVRTGEVVLVPEPEGWRIDSFALQTSRDTRDSA